MLNDIHDDVAHGGAASTALNGLGLKRSTAVARPALTIIIPCYNERNTVLDVIRMVHDLPVDKEIIVVDNCSTDGTRELLVEDCKGTPDASLAPTIEGQELLRGERFLLILQPKNFKKGTSVRTGVALARGAYVVCQDADLEYEPTDLVRLLDHARANGASAVFGSRLSEKETRDKGFGAFHVARIGLTYVFRVLYWTKITDVATCYKLMKTDAAQRLGMEASGFELDFEIPAKLRRQGIVIDEIPIAYHPRTHEAGKKIGWRDGVNALWTMAKHRL